MTTSQYSPAGGTGCARYPGPIQDLTLALSRILSFNRRSGLMPGQVRAMATPAAAAVAALAMIGRGHNKQSVLEIIILAGYRLDRILRDLEWTVSCHN
jgi:hypothetical protein